MNWQKFYMGDYARDTGHLTLIEHGAYRMLLDHYYSTERALPPDQATLHRITRAARKADRAAVERVVEQFFPIGEDGLRHNKRADAEISKHAVQVESNRRTGKLGGRPRKTESVTDREPNRLLEENRMGSISVSGKKPYQIPDKERKEAAPDGALDAVWRDGLGLLMGTGEAEKAARGFLGMCLGSHEPEHVLEALRAAHGKADPKGYVLAVLKAKPKRGELLSRLAI